MKPLSTATLIGTVPLLLSSTAFLFGPKATGTDVLAAARTLEQPPSAYAADPDPGWAEPPGETSCMWVIEPLTGTAHVIDVLFSNRPHLDILPHHCPNSFHVDQADDDDDDDEAASIATLPIGVLGNAFDITQIDINTVRLSMPQQQFNDGNSTLLAPLGSTYGDVGTPFEGLPCGCNSLPGDNDLDLLLRFGRQEVIDAFDLTSKPQGTDVLLRISARTSGHDIGFRVYDCVHIVRG